MSGTHIGGKKTAQTNIRRYGEDYYRIIGRKGGERTHAEGAKPKGFAAMPLEKRREAGAKGGRKSRRTK